MFFFFILELKTKHDGEMSRRKYMKEEIDWFYYNVLKPILNLPINSVRHHVITKFRKTGIFWKKNEIHRNFKEYVYVFLIYVELIETHRNVWFFRTILRIWFIRTKEIYRKMDNVRNKQHTHFVCNDLLCILWKRNLFHQPFRNYWCSFNVFDLSSFFLR